MRLEITSTWKNLNLSSTHGFLTSMSFAYFPFFYIYILSDMPATNEEHNKISIVTAEIVRCFSSSGDQQSYSIRGGDNAFTGQMAGFWRQCGLRDKWWLGLDGNSSHAHDEHFLFQPEVRFWFDQWFPFISLIWIFQPFRPNWKPNGAPEMCRSDFGCTRRSGNRNSKRNCEVAK